MKQVVNIFTKKSVFGALTALAFGLFLTIFAQAQNIHIFGPAGSSSFGGRIYTLPNGNFVVVDTEYDIPSGAGNVGAVHLYNGLTGALINTMTGAQANDRVGFGGIKILPNGNYVVSSPGWRNGAVVEVGAVTLCSAATGCPPTISPANSLVGSTAGDFVGEVTVLPNGKYVVIAKNWDNGAVQDVGAVTLCDGSAGCTGTISASNSLVGTTANDLVGNSGIVILTNGNYLVNSNSWNNGAVPHVGAITFCNAATGTVGAVSPANSLVGSTAEDRIGSFTEISSSVKALTNGNYVVLSPFWDNGAIVNAGAATFGSGTTGTSGAVSPSNSLVGSYLEDRVGWFSATALTNGNYVVCSPNWGDAGFFEPTNIGAATFGNGTTGISGTISAANSIIGEDIDNVCLGGVTALPNGNYVVVSPLWGGNSFNDAGAVTYGNGTSGTSGQVTAANSLAGTTDFQSVGSGGITVLANGNFVVSSPNYSNPFSFKNGAATLCSGTTGCLAGGISSANSLIGTNMEDMVGSGGVKALPNGNYVVSSPNWDNGAIQDAGAITLGDGSTRTAGAISSSNSVVGMSAGDAVGFDGVTVLANGNYVVKSKFWRNSGQANAGAATFRSGTDFGGVAVSPSNSLVGTTANDLVGETVVALTNGNYVVGSSNWNWGALTDAGAVTFGNGTTGISGAVSPSNSLFGTSPFDLVGDIFATPNGNYVVLSRYWDYIGGFANLGAVTGASGNVGVTGAISSSNSVLGLSPDSGLLTTFVFDSVNNQIIVGHTRDNEITISRPFAPPTAANISISGKVVNGKTGVSHASVTLTDAQGNVSTAKTNSFGYFRFEDVRAGQTLVIHVTAKGLVFNPQVVTAMEDITELLFTAQ